MVSRKDRRVNRDNRDEYSFPPHGPDRRTLTTTPADYVAECEFLIAERMRPYAPMTFAQLQAAREAGITDHRPAVGEMGWQDFHPPKPFPRRWVAKMAVTFSSEREYRDTLRSSMKEDSK